MYSFPSSVTFAALTIASAASTAPTKPLVSTIPSASKGISSILTFSVVEIKADCFGNWRQRNTVGTKNQETLILEVVYFESCSRRALRLLIHRSDERNRFI